MQFPGVISAIVALFGIYLMARVWRFSAFHGARFRTGLYFMKDAMTEIFRKKRIQHLRELRCDIIDTMDFIIGDYY